MRIKLRDKDRAIEDAMKAKQDEIDRLQDWQNDQKLLKAIRKSSTSQIKRKIAQQQRWRPKERSQPQRKRRVTQPRRK